MKLALHQGPSRAGNMALAIADVRAALTAAGALGAAALVMPEAFFPGYNQPDIAARALAANDPVFADLFAAAKATRCALVIGYAEAAGGAVFNSAIAISARGDVLANYRKIQLYGGRENAIYQPGNAYAVFDLEGLKAALLICYDVEFAPHIKALSDQGVQVILVPTANMMPFTHVAKRTVPAMSANHGVSIVYANYGGVDGDLTYAGGSVITGPHGEVLAQAGMGPALLIAELPPRDPAYLSNQSADLRQI